MKVVSLIVQEFAAPWPLGLFGGLWRVIERPFKAIIIAVLQEVQCHQKTGGASCLPSH